MFQSINSGCLLAVALFVVSCASFQPLEQEVLDPTQEEVFARGYRVLQRLAREESNEHLAFFVEYRDGTFLWGRWTEGTHSRVEFEKEWVTRLCGEAVFLTIVHTHTIEVPPGETDVIQSRRTERLARKCNLGHREMVVTPRKLWVLDFYKTTPAWCNRVSARTVRGARKRRVWFQREIDRLWRSEKSELITYYACEHRIRAQHFDHETPASHQ